MGTSACARTVESLHPKSQNVSFVKQKLSNKYTYTHLQTHHKITHVVLHEGSPHSNAQTQLYKHTCTYTHTNSHILTHPHTSTHVVFHEGSPHPKAQGVSKTYTLWEHLSEQDSWPSVKGRHAYPQRPCFACNKTVLDVYAYRGNICSSMDSWLSVRIDMRASNSALLVMSV